ncbi:YhjR family protein [Alcaligenaceae bacterium CGII-47]|nr:YhjR family protein [Alcaligenaceae bacterium CGII-47]
MNNETVGPVLMPSDDIVSLRAHLDVPDLGYVDVATEEAFEAGLRRWPLLAELHAWRMQYGGVAGADALQA